MSTEDCTSPTATGVYVQLAEYYELILDAFTSAGQKPWFEGEDAPTEKEKAQGCAIQAARRTGGDVSFLVVGGVFLVGLWRRLVANR
jgi:hypothetical protein